VKLTEEQRRAFRDHPEYGEGFYDAQCGEPIFNDASDPYRAGWEAFYAVKEILERNGFSRTSNDSYRKTMTLNRAALEQSKEK
jgi:hypothetical protein